MIEPEHAKRLGFSLCLRAGDKPATEAALVRLRKLGVRHARIPLHRAHFADGPWLDWMLGRLGDELTVLPCIEDLSTLDLLPDRPFDIIELAGTSLDGIPALLNAARQREGDAFVLGATPLLLAALKITALPDNVHALGLHLHPHHGVRLPTSADLAHDWAAACEHSPDLRLWVTDISSSSLRHELAAQAQAFLDALALPADRVYWNALADDAQADSRDHAAHLGIDGAAGEAKLLGRLLDSGVGEVRRVLSSTRRLSAPSLGGSKPVLITGGAGFIGANLADRLAADGHQVLIYDALARPGVERNITWLARRHPARVSCVLGDLRDEPSIAEAAAGSSVVFHLAGQVAVTTSMIRPLADFEVNARGTLVLLDALRRRNPGAPLIFASTNKVYGDLSDIELVRDGDCYTPKRADIRGRGIDETRPLCFHTPYGCSKGTADQYVLDYAHSFGLKTAVLRMSCIYGERQLGTEDQGWVAHFLLRAIAGEQLTIYGDGRQVRDVLHVGDAVDAYLAAWNRIGTVSGRAYNLGGGPANAISLLQLIEQIELLLGKRVDVEFSAWRPGDQRYFVADTSAICRELSLPAALGWRDGLARLAEHFGAFAPAGAQVAEAAL